MEIENFKGLRSLELNFNPEVTQFSGPNGSGKTTVVDAYLWTLTGKDSTGSEAFKVQPVDENNVTIPKLNTSVRLTFSINGETVTFERGFSQKWTKPRGTNEEVLKGNESSYIVNGVPLTMTEYYGKVREYICGADNFQLLSSVRAFFKLDTQTRRRKLIEMAGEMPDILTKEDFPNLYDAVQETKSVEGAKKQASKALSDLKFRAESIPSRMSENERDLPVDVDFNALKERKAEVESQISEIESELLKTSSSRDSAFETETNLKKKVYSIESKIYERKASIVGNLRSVKTERENELLKLKSELNSIDVNVKIKERRVSSNKAEIERLSAELQRKGEEWSKVNKSQPVDNTTAECPTCHRPFSEDELAEIRNELIASFNEGKVATLRRIEESGNNLKKQKESLESENKVLEEEIGVLNADIENKKQAISSKESEIAALPSVPDYSTDEKLAELNAAYESAFKELSDFNSSKEEDTTPTELLQKKSTLSQERDNLIKEIAMERMFDLVANRRKELEKEQEQISVEMAIASQILFEISQYQKAHIKAVEDKVSSLFSFVKFQMYEPNLTNDGEREICECLVNGVPYSSNLNYAAKVNAGLDIINGFSKYLGISAPVWIDNKESVSKIIAPAEQVITLSVNDNYSKLTNVTV